MEAVEAAAHVAGLDGDEDFQTAGEAQHGRGLASSRMRATASGMWPGAVMVSFAPPGRMSSMGGPVSDGASNSAGTSDRKAGCGRPGSPGTADLLRFRTHAASV